MNTPAPAPEDLFLNVRKAYRLLHDYQQMVLDAIRYIGSQLDIAENGGLARFAGDAGKGRERTLGMASWDYLPMILCEYHFLKGRHPEEWLSLSIFVVSDTGYYDADPAIAEKSRSESYGDSEKSKSKLIALIRPGHFEPTLFKDPTEMREFVLKDTLPEDVKAKGWTCKSFGMDQILSEERANEIVDMIVKMAATNGFELFRKSRA